MNHTLDQLRIQQRMTKARLARLYELMRDPDYPIDIAKAGVRDEKAKLARVDAEIAAGSTRPPSWGVEDYQAALHDGLGDISGLLELATSDEKNALYQLIGLRLTYTRTGPGKGHLAAVSRPRLEQRGEMLRVGAGTWYKSPARYKSMSWMFAWRSRYGRWGTLPERARGCLDHLMSDGNARHRGPAKVVVGDQKRRTHRAQRADLMANPTQVRARGRLDLTDHLEGRLDRGPASYRFGAWAVRRLHGPHG